MNALEPGSTLGGYKILARLRAGAMGVLYLARRISAAGFSRPVAIKVIHDHLAQNKRFCRMFIDEAKLSARIDDPNVVRVEEFGQADGRYYLVMEYVHGASLAQVIALLRKRGRISIEQAVAIAMQMASGLHGAHEATDEEGVELGVVHRDVSPHNVLVSYKGCVRIIDFGIAKARQVGGQTKTGSLRGKLAYMPPEQARSARTVDRRADLYGVGLVLWELLTFRRVFDADTDIAILNQIRDPQIQPPSTVTSAVPKALDDLVMRTLANDPDQRPATGAVLQRELADAVPGALRVLSGDLAAMMKKVRAAAEHIEGGLGAGGGDDATSYVAEVRGTLRTFSANMNDSVELVAELDTRPSRPDLDEGTAALVGAPVAPPPPLGPSGHPRIATMRMTPAAAAAAAAGVRPSDGVRRIVPPAPTSSADVLIPPPLSSPRGLVPPAILPPAPALSRPSYGDVLAGHPSSPELAASPQPLTAASLTTKQKIVAAAGLLVMAIIIAIAAVHGARNDAGTASAAPPLRNAADASPSVAVAAAPTLIAPVVIAPPEPPPEEAPDAATKAPGAAGGGANVPAGAGAGAGTRPRRPGRQP